MLLLVNTGHQGMLDHAHPNLGRLVQPRFYSSVEKTAALGIPWAADNDAYSLFHEVRYRAMLQRLIGLDGCIFVTAPDVVGVARETLALFSQWEPVLHEMGLPVGLVLQDGQEYRPVPWDRLEAVFVGGTTAWKLGPHAERLVREAKDREKWVHMGRVNSRKRLLYARAIGCDSVDGSSFAKFGRAHIPNGLEWATEDLQMRLA